MKHLKNITLFITFVFVFFIGASIINAGVKSKGENLVYNSKDNAQLRYLFVYDSELSPVFDSDVYEYDIIAPPKTDSVKISYRVASKNSSAEISDTTNLTNGSIVTIKVTNENGPSKEYKLTLRYSNSKLLYIILIVLIIIIILLAIGALITYILWKKGIIKFTKKEKKKIGIENYVN